MNKTVAAIDIGTNSVRLLIRAANGSELERQMRITRLGQDVDRTGELQEQAVERTVRVLENYRELLERHGVTKLRATATSAARDAKNSASFFRSVQQVLGQPPELLSGTLEAELSFRGATAELDPKDAPFVVFDIGGGSTEVSVGVTAPEASISVNIGGVRVTERFFAHDPPHPDELQQARRFAMQCLGEIDRAVDTARAKTWVGLAGTVTSLAAMTLGLKRYDPKKTHGFELSRGDVTKSFVALRTAPLEQREAMLAQPERAPVIVGGALVLDAFFEYFHLEKIHVSELDILDGLAASFETS